MYISALTVLIDTSIYADTQIFKLSTRYSLLCIFVASFLLHWASFNLRRLTFDVCVCFSLGFGEYFVFSNQYSGATQLSVKTRPRYASRGTAKFCSLAQIVADRNATIGAHLRGGCGSFTVALRIGLQLKTTPVGRRSHFISALTLATGIVAGASIIFAAAGRGVGGRQGGEGALNEANGRKKSATTEDTR